MSILADIRIKGLKKKYFIRLHPTNFPRIGESMKLGSKRYRIVEIEHQFEHYKKMPGAFHDEKWFANVPGLEITLEPINVSA